MKKFAYSILIMILLVTGCAGVAMASRHQEDVAPEELALGGVSVGTTYQAVVDTYGRPAKKMQINKRGMIPKDMEINYGTGVTIDFYKNRVATVTITANNGWTTPAGIGVGSTYDDIIAAYGEEYCYISKKVISDGKGIMTIGIGYHCGIRFTLNNWTVTKMESF